MSRTFDALQKRYQALAARQGEAGPDLEDVRSFVGDVREAGAVVADLDERSQLRAWARFLATVVADTGGGQIDITLEPLVRGQLVVPRAERKERRTLPPVGWALMGAAAMVVVAGLLLLLRLGDVLLVATPAPPAPSGSVAVGPVTADDGEMGVETGVFCLGTARLAACFTLDEPLPAEARWNWKLSRGGRAVATGPSLAWDTASLSRTVEIALPGGSPLEAGEYEVANRAFRVLAEEPWVGNVRVSAVPGGESRAEFAPGVRVLYVAYDYANACPGQPITRTVALEGEVVYSGSAAEADTAGSGEWVYHGVDGLPLAGGEYEAAANAGMGEVTAAFRIGAVAPAFGPLTIALGVQADGAPLFAAGDAPYDWNTRTVYAIFDYAGMRDGVTWEAVWTRGGVEVGSQRGLWDAERDGAAGTYWVTLYDARGWVLTGGEYSVALSVDGRQQGEARFQIAPYAPPEQ